MTERYQMIHLGNLYDYVIKDHIGNKTYDMIHNKEHKKEIVNVLNKQHKTIQELRCDIESRSQDDYICFLKNENKELKKLCNVLIKEIEKKSIVFLIDDDIKRMLEYD